MVFTVKYRGLVSCKFSHHPILWTMLYITQNISHWSDWSASLFSHMIASFNLTKPQFATAPPPLVTWATLETPEIAVPPPLGRTSVTWTPWRWETPPGCGRCRRSVSERPSRSKSRVVLALDGLGAGLLVNTKIPVYTCLYHMAMLVYTSILDYIGIVVYLS